MFFRGVFFQLPKHLFILLERPFNFQSSGASFVPLAVEKLDFRPLSVAGQLFRPGGLQHLGVENRVLRQWEK